MYLYIYIGVLTYGCRVCISDSAHVFWADRECVDSTGFTEVLI